MVSRLQRVLLAVAATSLASRLRGDAELGGGIMGKWYWPVSANSTPETPDGRVTSHRWHHIALSTVALVGWMTFILACVEGPAWSPDSSKVLFGYYDPGGSRYAVALYDLPKHKTRILFERPATANGNDDDFALLPAWQNDGGRALLFMTEGSSESTKHCSLFSLPVNSKGTLRTYDLGNAKNCWHSAMVLQKGDKLYLAGDDGVNWTNLTTGETGSREIKGGPGLLHQWNDRVEYMRSSTRPLAGAKEKDTQEDGIEFGQIDLASFAMKPAFTIWQTQFPDIKVGDSISAAWEPSGSRMALIGRGEDSDKILMMEEAKGPTGSSLPQPGSGPMHFGNLLWSQDGTTLYAAAITNGAKEKSCNFSLAEIPVSGAPGRLTPIAAFPCDGVSRNDVEDKLDILLPLALSPDGHWIAATPSNCDNDTFASPDHALFLIDLRRSDRRIMRIPFPTVPKPGRLAATKTQ